MKYDNCKNCKSNCEHAGKDREFICPGGITCKILYSKEAQAKAAAEFVSAIKTIANKPENLENLENYLSHHFEEWLEKYANTPDNMAAEMREFAEMRF